MPEPIKYDLLKHYKKCIRDYPTARRCRGLDTAVYRWALVKTNSFVGNYFWNGFSGKSAIPLGGSHRGNKLWKELVTHNEMDCDVPYISPKGRLKHVKVKIKHSFKDARNIINAKVYTWLGPQALEIAHWRAEIKRGKDNRMIIEEKKIKYPGQGPSGPSQPPAGPGLKETRRLLPNPFARFMPRKQQTIPSTSSTRPGSAHAWHSTTSPRTGSLQWMAQGLDTARQRRQERLIQSRNARMESRQARLPSYSQNLSRDTSLRPGSLQWYAQSGGLYRPRQTSVRPAGQMLAHGAHTILAPHQFASFSPPQSALARRGTLPNMARGLRG